jgi:hypothetical protein
MRALPAAYRPARSIKVGYEIEIGVASGDLRRVLDRVETRDGSGRLVKIAFTLEGVTEPFYAEPGFRIWSRYTPTTN